jgi:hypothetical protein
MSKLDTNDWLLRVEAGRLFERYDRDFFTVRTHREPPVYRLSFCYHRQEGEGGPPIHYIDVTATKEEMLNLEEHHRRAILSRVEERLKQMRSPVAEVAL